MLARTICSLLNSYMEVTILTPYIGVVLVVFKEKEIDRFLESIPDKRSVSDHSRVMTWVVVEFKEEQEEVGDTVAEAGMLFVRKMFLLGKNLICM